MIGAYCLLDAARLIVVDAGGEQRVSAMELRLRPGKGRLRAGHGLERAVITLDRADEAVALPALRAIVDQRAPLRHAKTPCRPGAGRQRPGELSGGGYQAGGGGVSLRGTAVVEIQLIDRGGGGEKLGVLARILGCARAVDRREAQFTIKLQCRGGGFEIAAIDQLQRFGMNVQKSPAQLGKRLGGVLDMRRNMRLGETRIAKARFDGLQTDGGDPG